MTVGRSAKEAPLFNAAPGTPGNSTSQIAGRVAAGHSQARYQQILDILRETPSTLFEISSRLECSDHQISGRITELLRDRRIEETGETRNKPETGSPCRVYRLCGTGNLPVSDASSVTLTPSDLDRLFERSGYPLTIFIDQEPYDRQPADPTDTLPGLSYIRRADRVGLRLAVRVHLVDCPVCGMPLHQVIQDSKRTLRCTRSGCTTIWECQVTANQGHGALVALVSKQTP